MKTHVLAVLLAGLAVQNSQAVSGADFGRVLTATEVKCEEDLGHRLVLRLNAFGGQGVLSTFLWRSGPGGVFRGLAAYRPHDTVTGHFFRDEAMTFDLIFKADEDYL